MARTSFSGPLNARRILQTSSSQEALNFDAQEVTQPDEAARAGRGAPVAVHRDGKSRLQRWWQRHVRLSIPHDDCRDHFGKQLSPCVDFQRNYQS